MSGSHRKILYLLVSQPLTALEISKHLNMAVHGVRGRISELRTFFNYTIHFDRTTQKYNVVFD